MSTHTHTHATAFHHRLLSLIHLLPSSPSLSFDSPHPIIIAPSLLNLSSPSQPSEISVPQPVGIETQSLFHRGAVSGPRGGEDQRQREGGQYADSNSDKRPQNREFKEERRRKRTAGKDNRWTKHTRTGKQFSLANKPTNHYAFAVRKRSSESGCWMTPKCPNLHQLHHL